MLLFIWSAALYAVQANQQCTEMKLTSATSNSDIEESCNSDNCGIMLAGESQKVVLDVVCPYAAVSCLSSGYDHQIEINCYNCHVSDRCTNSNLGTQLTYNDSKTSTQYSSLLNCDCTAITQCQTNITSNYCPNSNDIELDFKATDEETQYIECQRACYENTACIYGIYYSSEWSQCRFISGGCLYSEFIDPSGSYYFVSKGCTSFSNGSFRSILFPKSTTIAPTKKKNGFDSALTASGGAVLMLIFVVLFLARRIFGGRCRSAMRRRNQQNRTQQAAPSPNANAGSENQQIQRNPTYPAAVQQQQQSYTAGQQVILPNGQIAIVKPVPVQQAMPMNQSPYNPAMQYASAPVQKPAHSQPRGQEQPYTMQ